MKTNAENIKRFTQTMHTCVEGLYARVHESNAEAELLPSALKELGVATEELQVATEELYEQKERWESLLDATKVKLQHYQNLFHHLPEACLMTTAEGKILEANFKAARLLGLQPDQLVGKLLISFVPSDSKFAFRTYLNQFSLAGLPQLGQSSASRTWLAWLQGREAEPIHLSITASTIFEPDAQQFRLYWILRETTETWEGIVSPKPVELSDASTPATSSHQPPEQTFAKGDIISLNARTLWQVREGVVKITTLTEDNEEILLGLLRSPLVFGLGSSALPIYQAIALTSVKLAQFSLAEVKASPDLAQQLLPLLNQRFQQTELLLSIAGQRRVKDRLCYLLKLLQQEIGELVEGGKRLSVRFTHEELASACCTTRVTITRLLGELQRQHKLFIDSKSHIILNEKYWDLR